MAIEVIEYIDSLGRSPFGRWFDRLDRGTSERVQVVLRRMEDGKLSSARGVGGGVLEYRINVGPGTGSISAGTETP